MSQPAWKRAVVVGPYRIHNFGDDLVGAIIAKHLQKQGYSVSVPLLEKANADWLGTHYAERYGKLIEEADTIVVGGGGILSDTSGPRPGMSYLGTVARHAVLGNLSGKKVYVTSVGAGPWLLENSKFLTLTTALIADKIGVRDEESYNHLKGLGVNTRRVVQGADLALISSDYLDFKPEPQNRIGLQFDIGSFKASLNNPHADAIVRAVKEYASKNPDNVALVSNVDRNSQLRDKSTSECARLNYRELETFLPKLAGLNAFFSSHLHQAIVAYSQRIPTFSLYVREKTRRFYEQIGRPERAIDLSTATVEDFHRLIQEVENAAWTDQDEETLQQLKAQSRTLLDFVT